MLLYNLFWIFVVVSIRSMLMTTVGVSSSVVTAFLGEEHPSH